ncbi:hemin ABC transporter substrate-binding protein [Sulfitobacter donghicola DSW-25 = KCTC 12864 = JCM 14565]|uniref:Hemin ABC transporter substrate-binding protein n=2 Tax=Sulfitobacter TaxID=60136 RepID=A0A073IDU9_9RHOB|nr:hemin ABC transporter substrate-binding protein [Sulfitobacter donghicola DSW-25 = KCTC 12864 = JCM 14565]
MAQIRLAASAAVLAAVTMSVVPSPLKSQASAQDRVLSIGGSVTEIVYALKQEHRLIARDTTSSFPAEVMDLPDVGYMRALSPEGVLSVGPNLIISEDGAGPQETIDALEAVSIPFITVPDGYSAEGVIEKIRVVGRALDVDAAAAVLADEIANGFEQAAENLKKVDDPKRVLFILSTQGGRILASGTETAAHGIIEMAGGINAITSFTGYKPLTDEAVALAAPDVILMMDRMGDHQTDTDELFAMPALVPTPAAREKAIVRMNGLYLLGFGPRTAQAALDLNTALYGQ